MGNSIESLDQVDVAIEDPAKIERRHIETAFRGKAHCREFHPALGEAVTAHLELGDPWLLADRGSGLGSRSAERWAGRQERAQVLVQLVNVLRTLGGFREFGKSELFPRSWPVTPRGDALGSLGSGPEGQRAHPVIPRSKNEIGIARQAIAHRLVHKVLAPASGAASRIPLKTAKPSSVW